jgi:hypothetical protein
VFISVDQKITYFRVEGWDPWNIQVGQTQLGSFWSLMTNQSNNTRENGKAAAIYRQQKVFSHFPVCCWIDWLLIIKNCLIESGPPYIWENMCCSVAPTFFSVFVLHFGTYYIHWLYPLLSMNFSLQVVEAHSSSGEITGLEYLASEVYITVNLPKDENWMSVCLQQNTNIWP